MELRITGLQQVQRRLSEAPKQIVTKAFAKALDRAAGVIAAEVEALTPEGPDGELKESIRVPQVEVDVQGRGGEAVVGFSSAIDERTGKPQDLIAFWVEYGHRMVTHEPGKKEIGRVAAHPFVRPAFDASADKAIEVFAETLIDSLSLMEESK